MSQQRYRTAVKSSSMIGGAAFVNMFIGLIKTKVVAVLLGPSGMGLMNVYSTLIGPVTTISNMGFHTSGVRAIAGTKDSAEELSKMAKILRRMVWVTGLFGCFVTVFFSKKLSEITFQNQEHVVSIAYLGLVVLFSNLSMGQVCLLQGTRRIVEVAKVNIWGALYAAFLSLPCYWFLGKEGILPSLVLSSLAVMITSWWFVRKISIIDVELSGGVFAKEAKNLLAFGLPVMATAVQTSITAYLIRLIIINRFGLEGVGIWAAAYTISGVLVNFVLQAMGTDYYPRLVAVAHDNEAFNEEINTQLEIGLLLSLPALLATILFAPLGIEVLYSGKFNTAIPILRWSVFGILGRVLSWPLSFTMLALGRGKLFFYVELSANVLHLLLVYYCSIRWGLAGTGIGFVILYFYYFVLMFFITRRIAKTRLFAQSVKLTVIVLLLLIFASVFSFYLAENLLYYVVSVLILAFIALLVLAKISDLTGMFRQVSSNC